MLYAPFGMGGLIKVFFVNFISAAFDENPL
ncbi:hypothetical protein EDC63_13510 [Sulfurirhabdus autotrophica]|uniref:Uncharacterized protein n=1 Tax=Sulfurirhabdus autotrophica TaxID=1706046 RepID=A0A4R3XNZ0_9PROT|nr:hypothetical protein EDC63_13510 [Sulfurirhabdus autotrophica]